MGRVLTTRTKGNGIQVVDPSYKGTGEVVVAAGLSSKRTQTAKIATVTLTAAEVLTRIIDGTPVAAATYTFPTAALLIAALVGAPVGTSFSVYINNKAAGADTITVAAGTGGTADGTLTVAQNVIREFVITITGAATYALYGLGA